MSIIKELFPFCDICNQTFPDSRGFDTVAALRKSMCRGGWKIKGGKDVCPDCERETTRTSAA